MSKMVNIDASTPQLKLVKEWFSAYASLDAEKLEPLLSKNYKQQTLPESIGLPEETKEEHIKRFREMPSAITKLEVIVQEVIEAPGKVVAHVTTVGATIYGTTITSDSVCILSLVEEDGELKVLRSKEFSDPQQYRDYHSAKAAAEGAGAS